jgi:transcriptional regulator with XRE-family HTH domain
MSSGPELKAARKRENVTLDELAREAGWSHRAVPAGFEARVTVTPKTSKRYRDALDAIVARRAAMAGVRP